MKENIIIGKLIPVGTGTMTYRNIDTHAPDCQPMEYYSSDAEEDVDPSEWLARIGPSAPAQPPWPVPGDGGEVAEVVDLPVGNPAAGDCPVSPLIV